MADNPDAHNDYCWFKCGDHGHNPPCDCPCREQDGDT